MNKHVFGDFESMILRIVADYFSWTWLTPLLQSPLLTRGFSEIRFVIWSILCLTTGGCTSVILLSILSVFHLFTRADLRTKKIYWEGPDFIWLCCHLSVTVVCEPASGLKAFLWINVPVLWTCKVSEWWTRGRKRNISVWHSSLMAIILSRLCGFWFVLALWQRFYFILTHTDSLLIKMTKHSVIICTVRCSCFPYRGADSR